MTDVVSLGSEKETANSAAVSLFPDSELTCSDNAVQLACKTENKNNSKRTNSIAYGQSEKSESETDKHKSFNENSTPKETNTQAGAYNSMTLRSSPRKSFTTVSHQFNTPEKKRKDTFGISPTKQVIAMYYLIGSSRKPDPNLTFVRNKSESGFRKIKFAPNIIPSIFYDKNCRFKSSKYSRNNNFGS